MDGYTNEVTGLNIPTITITRMEYDALLKAEEILSALENGGVDNWEGYEESLESAGL